MAEYVSRNWRQRPDGTTSEALAPALPWLAMGRPCAGPGHGAGICGGGQLRGSGGRLAIDAVNAARPAATVWCWRPQAGAINLRLAAHRRLTMPEPMAPSPSWPIWAVWWAWSGAAVVLWMLLLALLTLARLVG
jgi:adenosylcobinamide-phosphate synthase